MRRHNSDPDDTDKTAVTGDVVHGHKVGGDMVGGDKITVGDVDGSYNAIGAGAKVIVNQIQQAFSTIDEMEKGIRIAEKQLAKAIERKIYRYTTLADINKIDDRENPYKALLNYKLEDAPFFYGRQEAVSILLEKIRHERLTILHSESGSGKTSLLQAGLSSRLLADGAFPLYVRPYNVPPDRAIKQAFLRDYATQPELARFRDETMTLAGFLERVTHYLGGRKLLILLDQFEEYFTELSTEDQEIFAEQLHICIESDLPVDWVLALRKEYFSDLRIFRALRPFENEYFLPTFKMEEAQEVIVEPAALKGVNYQPGLVDKIIEDIRQGAERVAPVQVQLVCHTLFDELMQDENQQTITEGLYNLRRGRGGGQSGAEGILTSHLSRVLDNELKGEERKVASYVLESLVTSDIRRVVKSEKDLQANLGKKNKTLDYVLEVLYENRLIHRSLDDSDQPRYELAHDYLLTEIEIDPESQARKAAAELLAREIVDWQNYGVLMPPQTLKVVGAQRESLVFDTDSLQLVGKSALFSGVDIDEWVAFLPADMMYQILLDALDSSEKAVVVRALENFDLFYDENAEKLVLDLIDTSNDDDIFDAALRLLGRQNPDKSHRVMVIILQNSSTSRRIKIAYDIRDYLNAEIVDELFRYILTHDNIQVTRAVLSTLASDGAAPFMSDWQQLRRVSFSKRVAVYKELQALHIRLPLGLQLFFSSALAIDNVQASASRNPIWFGARALTIIAVIYVALAFWQGWWPFLQWEAVAGVDDVSLSALVTAPDEGGVYVGSWDYGLGYLSSNGEWSAWRKGNLPTSTPADFDDPTSNVATLEQLAVDPDHPDRLYAAVYEAGVWRSDDSGWNWVDISAGQVPTDVIYLGLAVYEQQLMLVTSSGPENDSNVYGSSDAGETWQALAGKEGLPIDTHFTTVAIDPFGTAYVGTSDSFFEGSNVDDQWRWREVMDVPSASHIALGSEKGELFISFSGSDAHKTACLSEGKLGETMEFSRDNPITAVTAHPTESNQYYLVAESVYRVDCEGNQVNLKSTFGTDYVPGLVVWIDADGEEHLIQATGSGLYQRQP